MFKGIRQWLIDTYNGIYVIVLKPHMPSYATVAAVVLACLFGILWGYVISPVVFYDASPRQMSVGYRDEWIKQVALAYSMGAYTPEDAVQHLNRVENPAAAVERLATNTTGAVQESLLRVQAELINQTTGSPAPRPGPIWQDVLGIALAVVVTIIGALIISPVWRLLLKPNIYDNIYEAVRPKSKEEIEAKKKQQEERTLIRQKKEEEAKMREESAASAATNPYGAPIMQKLSVYTKGRSFDDSFAIEDENDMFLGECGATIAKTIGDTNEPAAIEVWLFDKEDFVRTLNKLFVSEHAYNDMMLRSELEGRVDDPVNDLVVVRPGAVIHLETDAILFQAKVTDLKYGDNGILPPNSFFETLKIQAEAWQKKGGGAARGMATPVIVPAMPVGVPATPTMPPPATYAPPAQPIQPIQPLTPPAQIYAPPPVPPAAPPPPRRLPQDDDPFGGTGDFTPVGQ